MPPAGRHQPNYPARRFRCTISNFQRVMAVLFMETLSTALCQNLSTVSLKDRNQPPKTLALLSSVVSSEEYFGRDSFEEGCTVWVCTAMPLFVYSLFLLRSSFFLQPAGIPPPNFVAPQGEVVEFDSPPEHVAVFTSEEIRPYDYIGKGTQARERPHRERYGQSARLMVSPVFLPQALAALS